MNDFQKRLEKGRLTLRKRGIEVLQVNLGKRGNQLCVHCHVDAGPDRKEENMGRDTVEAVLRFLRDSRASTLDITGGAPERNPHFEVLVEKGREMGCHVIDRCNLTVFFVPGREGLPKFLARNRVEIMASLPCYTRDNVDRQRGPGVFDQSILALRRLNELGYGEDGTGLRLNLVYNPLGPFLPPPQEPLEQEYKARLLEDFGIRFTRLHTLTNMPIHRFAHSLKETGEYSSYVRLLEAGFHAETVQELMCRYTLSVGWDGRLYDCDFNQTLGIPLGSGPKGAVPTIFDATLELLEAALIMTAAHCFGCTAGRGSSCQGALLR